MSDAPSRSMFWPTVSAGLALGVIAGTLLGSPHLWQPAAVALAVTSALAARGIPSLRGYQYTMWVVAAVIAAMVYPVAFQHWGPIDLRNKTLMLVIIQLVMRC